MNGTLQESANLLSLPFDVLLDIATHLSGRDLAHLLSTCRILHTHITDDAFWRPKCAPFSLTDISNSHYWAHFLDAYPLLDTYGPLLGLWAGDQPYLGGILEFRLDIADSSIVGELWHFPHAGIPDDADPDAITNPELLETVRLRAADGHIDLDQDIQVVGPTHERAVLFYPPFPPSPLPEFPAPDVPWLDRAPRLPRLPAQPPASSADLRAAETLPPYPAISMAPSAALKPPAITLVLSATNAVAYAHAHALYPLRDMRNLRADGGHLCDGGALGFCPRYYPMRTPPLFSPRGAEWSAAALEGLWLGDYGPPGTEVVYMEWDAPRGAVCAWKVTGDLHVPRGAQSWIFECARAVQAVDVVDAVGETWVVQAGDVVDAFGEAWVLESTNARVFAGIGTVCGTGFRVDERTTTDVFVAVVGDNVVKVLWVELGHRVALYRRYKQNMGKEKDRSGGVHV